MLQNEEAKDGLREKRIQRARIHANYRAAVSVCGVCCKMSLRLCEWPNNEGRWNISLNIREEQHLGKSRTRYQETTKGHGTVPQGRYELWIPWPKMVIFTVTIHLIEGQLRGLKPFHGTRTSNWISSLLLRQIKGWLSARVSLRLRFLKVTYRWEDSLWSLVHWLRWLVSGVALRWPRLNALI